MLPKILVLERAEALPNVPHRSITLNMKRTESLSDRLKCAINDGSVLLRNLEGMSAECRHMISPAHHPSKGREGELLQLRFLMEEKKEKL